MRKFQKEVQKRQIKVSPTKEKKNTHNLSLTLLVMLVLMEGTLIRLAKYHKVSIFSFTKQTFFWCVVYPQINSTLFDVTKLRYIFIWKYCYFFICSDKIWCRNTPSEKLIEMILQKNNNKKTNDGSTWKTMSTIVFMSAPAGFLPHGNRVVKHRTLKKNWVKKIVKIALCISICLFFSILDLYRWITWVVI